MKIASGFLTQNPQMITPEIKRRFWSKVDRSHQCWIWKGAIAKGSVGYGTLDVLDGMRLAHRISWLISFGAIPYGKCVLHRCDNPKCVNPNHLWLGTRAQNLEDMTNKGRRAVGFEVGGKCTLKMVEEIRKASASGATQKILSERYNLGQATICRIVNRKHYAYF